MRYRKLDENYDMQFGNQQSDFWRDVPDAPAQAVLTRLRLWTQEWFLDLSDGTPYQDGILGIGTQETIEPILRQRISETQSVNDILSLDIQHDKDSRITYIATEIDTDYGAIIIEGTV